MRSSRLKDEDDNEDQMGIMMGHQLIISLKWVIYSSLTIMGIVMGLIVNSLV